MVLKRPEIHILTIAPPLLCAQRKAPHLNIHRRTVLVRFYRFTKYNINVILISYLNM